jgi:hypothetical protein
VAYVVIAVVAVIVLVGLVLVGAMRLGSSSVQIRGSMTRFLSFEISLARAEDPPQLGERERHPVPERGRHRPPRPPAHRNQDAGND